MEWLNLIWYFIDIVSVIAVAAIIIYGWKAVWENRWRVGFLEMLILLILFSQVPPLVGFAVYFCCIHSTQASIENLEIYSNNHA